MIGALVGAPALMSSIVGCAATSATLLVQRDFSGEGRGYPAGNSDIDVCSSEYSQAFERAKDDAPPDPMPSASGSTMAIQAAASVDVWRSKANQAFTDCMRSRK